MCEFAKYTVIGTHFIHLCERTHTHQTANSKHVSQHSNATQNIRSQNCKQCQYIYTHSCSEAQGSEMETFSLDGNDTMLLAGSMIEKPPKAKYSIKQLGFMMGSTAY